MNKVIVILNPAAKGDRARLLKEKIEALSLRISVRMTSAPGDAGKIARNALQEGVKTIVAAGGDGTINEVVNGIAGSDVQFGIFPLGTMNVFALELGIPLNDLARAWKVIEEGHCREIDLAMANDHYFVQLAGVGLDAQVVRETSVGSKKALGPLSYMLSLINVVARKPPLLSAETAEGLRFEGRFIMVGNGRFYGGPFTMFKKASLDDGRLDVVVFRNQSHWHLIRYIQALLFKNHDMLPDVDYFQTSSLRVRSEQAVPFELDGELSDSLPVNFHFSEKCLRVLVPANGKNLTREGEIHAE
ncbi:MAG: diacylglycerol kinase family protein [Chthoniobacterales bacterium]